MRQLQLPAVARSAVRSAKNPSAPAVIGLAVFSLSLILPASGLAADRYRIDNEHTSVIFVLQHEKWAKYQGTIRIISGFVMFDKNDVTASSVEVKMLANSVDTLNKAREAELQSEALMNVPKFADITFKSTSVVKTGDSTGTVTGDFTLAGVTKPVSLDVTFDGQAVSSWDDEDRISFSARGSFSALDYMPNFLAEGPVIDFTIEVEAIRSGG